MYIVVIKLVYNPSVFYPVYALFVVGIKPQMSNINLWSHRPIRVAMAPLLHRQPNLTDPLYLFVYTIFRVTMALELRKYPQGWMWCNLTAHNQVPSR